MMHNVRIYTIPNCPYCIRAKNLLRNNQIDFQEIYCIDASDLPGDLVTFPQIYADKDHLGGCQELFTYFRSN